MKLPNNYGTIYKLSGNRRRPWVVKKRIGGRQKAVAYCETREEGLKILADLNADPLMFSSRATFSEIFRCWKVQKWPKISAASQSGYEICYKHCGRLHDMVFQSIKFGHLQAVIDDVRAAGAGYATQKKCRVLMEQLYSYAAKYDIVTRDYARYVEIDTHHRKYSKRPFTARERSRLWKMLDVPGIADVLILIYTGLRIGEYLALRVADIKIRQQFFIVRDSKTEAGRNRPVPIARKIWPLIEARIHAGHGLICCHDDGQPLTYWEFRRLFDRALADFRTRHTPHETRHTCASMLDSAGANDTAVKMILGHARQGVTKKDYTHKTIRELRKAIDLI